MFNRLRWSAALPALALSFVFSANSHAQTATNLEYSAEHLELRGYSTTYVEPDGGSECTEYDYAYFPGFPDPIQYCIYASMWTNGSGVRGWVTNPSSYRYFYDESFSDFGGGSTTIYYEISKSPGTWTADALHYEGMYYYENCHVSLPMYPYPGYIMTSTCDLVSSDPMYMYLNATWDSANAP